MGPVRGQDLRSKWSIVVVVDVAHQRLTILVQSFCCINTLKRKEFICTTVKFSNGLCSYYVGRFFCLSKYWCSIVPAEAQI